MKIVRHLLTAPLVLLLLGYAAVCSYVYTKQGEIIYLPTRVLEGSPRDFGLAYEDLHLPVRRAAGKNEAINAWWIPAPRPNGYSVLFLHGNALNIGSGVDLGKAIYLVKAGYNVLTLDYRGYGLSDGDVPYEAALYEDARAGLDELERREPDLHKRLIHGHSLGGAVAIDLAAQRPEAAALVVESSFESILGMSAVLAAYRYLPVDLLLTERFDSIAKVPKLKLPVLFIQGTADPLVPEPMAERLFAAAPSPKRLVVIDGGHHSDLQDFTQYRDALRGLPELIHAPAVMPAPAGAAAANSKLPRGAATDA